MSVAQQRLGPRLSPQAYAIRMAEGNTAAGETGWAAAYDHLVENGHYHLSAPLPEGLKRMPARKCYSNAFKLVTDHQGLNYAEGLAGVAGVAIWHAWAVTDDGQVVDPTWGHPEEFLYFGIAVPRVPYVVAVIRTCRESFMLILEAAFVRRWGAMPELLPLPNSE
jgi:hypothetical protein